MTQKTGGETRGDCGATKRGLPGDYAGDDPESCNAPTKSGRPCRALALGSGHCKLHGGFGEGRRMRLARERFRESVAERLKKLGYHERPHRAGVRAHE